MSAVSILVPTYNRSALLKECLDSLLATTVDCEIIVGDNASDDDTEAVMATYTDPRLRYVRHATNTGGFDNYNFLLAAATKEYLCLFGDDDIALPGCFEKKLAILDQCPEVAGVYSSLRVMDADGILSDASRVHGVPLTSHIGGRDDFAHLLINCGISWQTLVFRKDLYDTHGGLVNAMDTYAVDWDYLITISKGSAFAFLNEPTVGVRFHAGSGGNKAAVESGHFVRDMLRIWRKWLLESDDLPVVTGMTWQAFARLLRGASELCYGPDESRPRAFLADLDALRRAYIDRMNRDFYQRLSQWLPEAGPLDAGGLPIFRPGLIPLPVDTTQQILFFHHPTWSGAAWKAVLTAYATAFAPEADVELVFWLDPAQGVPAATASTLIVDHLASLGIEAHRAPPIQVLTEPLDLARLARLYTAVHVVVPAGDPTQLTRGTQVGTVVMTRLEPEIWRRVVSQLLGLPVTAA